MPSADANPLHADKQARLKALRAKLDKLMTNTRAPSIGTTEPPSSPLRRPLSGPPPVASATPSPPLRYRRDLPRTTPRPTRPTPGPETPVVLKDAVQGAEWRHPLRGPVFGVDTRMADLPDAGTVGERLCRTLMRPHAHLATRFACLTDCDQLAPQELLFMDIESTGLSNSPLFLIGILVWEGNAWVVRQYFARNYAEEPATLAFFSEACRDRRLLITFNGKSYDMPFIRARCAATGVSPPAPIEHFDLLHESRRVWREQLPDCRLQTLERFICGRLRHGDIPGDQIPEAYHRYVRTDNAWQMVDVLKHNMLDLVTLADLIPRLGASVKDCMQTDETGNGGR